MDSNGINNVLPLPLPAPLPAPVTQPTADTVPTSAAVPSMTAVQETTPLRPVESAEHPAPREEQGGSETRNPSQDADTDRIRAAAEGKGLRLDRRI